MNKYGNLFYENLLIELQRYFQENGMNTYQNNNEWTKVITKNENNSSLIDNALHNTFPHSRFGNEYYRIDNCIYEDINEGYKTENKMKFHQWKLLAAVEHENQWDDWSDELVKLAYVQCPLRVVISYGDYNPEKEEYTNAIYHANRVAEAINLQKYVHGDEEFVLIFGPRISSIKNNRDISQLYKAYIWNGKCFHKI